MDQLRTYRPMKIHIINRHHSESTWCGKSSKGSRIIIRQDAIKDYITLTQEVVPLCESCKARLRIHLKESATKIHERKMLYELSRFQLTGVNE
jgi:hypothetical protein